MVSATAVTCVSVFVFIPETEPPVVPFTPGVTTRLAVSRAKVAATVADEPWAPVSLTFVEAELESVKVAEPPVSDHPVKW